MTPIRKLVDYRFQYLSVLPGLILIFGISYYPLGYSVYLTLFKGSLARLEYAGIVNYRRLLTDEFFWESLRISFTYTAMCVLITLTSGTGTGLLLAQPGKVFRAFKYVLIMPWVVSQVVAGLIWKWMFNAELGIVNETLVLLGFSRANWLSRPASALAVMIVVSVWVMLPFSALIAYTSIISLQKELFEAARMDGANSSQVFFRVTVPLLRPTFLVLLVILTIYFFNFITIMMTITRGGPSRSTMVLPLYMWQLAFEYLDLGYGSVVALVLFVINTGLSIGYMKLMKTEMLY